MARPRRLTSLAAAAFVALARAPAAEERPGRIVGGISPAGAATKVSAIDRNVVVPVMAREVPVREYPGRVLEGGARYEVEVPPGTYDLHVETADGRVLEGADLRVSAPEGARPFSERDEQAIRERIAAMKLFENEKTVLALRGAGERARVLVKLVRTEPTSYDGEFGEPVAVFRWEVWEFRRRTGSWVKEGAPRVLRRFLVPRRRSNELRWEFLPELGGIELAPEATVRRDVSLPPEAAPAKEGRPQAARQ